MGRLGEQTCSTKDLDSGWASKLLQIWRVSNDPMILDCSQAYFNKVVVMVALGKGVKLHILEENMTQKWSKLMKPHFRRAFRPGRPGSFKIPIDEPIFFYIKVEDVSLSIIINGTLNLVHRRSKCHLNYQQGSMDQK